VKAGKIEVASIVARSVSATLRITLATLRDGFRGRNRRVAVDERLRWWSGRLLELVDLRCTVVNPGGVAPVSGQPTIIMSNHGSIYDIPLIFVAMSGSIRMLTKKELFRVPLWGRGMAAAEFIAIDRKNHEQAIAALAEAKTKMASGIVVWVAPEGTRSRDGDLGPFKKGGFVLALQTGATILPVGIRGARDVLPPGTLAVNLGKTSEIHVGAPIDASAYSSEQRDELIATVKAEIRRLAGLA